MRAASAQNWANVTGLLTPEVLAWTVHYWQTMPEISKHSNNSYVTPQEEPYKYVESNGTFVSVYKYSMGVIVCTIDLAALTG